MLLGFISLLLTIGQSPISNICISEKVGSTWHPCSKKKEVNINKVELPAREDENRRKLLKVSDSGGSLRRLLAGGTTDNCGTVSA